jgi:homoserine O-acetyltransferase/O-succinyltransferase
MRWMAASAAVLSLAVCWVPREAAAQAAADAGGKMLTPLPMPTRQPPAAQYPPATEADYTLKDFKFKSGQTMDIHMHVHTIGTPKTDAAGKTTNAVLIMHGTTGTGTQFTVPGFGGQLFGKGQLLDADKYFLIMTDDIGHGKSSRPSEGMRAKFPNYGYEDMIEGEYRLLTEGMKVNHLRLCMGTSMGGMHTWLWGEDHPDFMDALMPLASSPDQIAGRNRVWRRILIDAIRQDPEWKGGEYTTQPRGLGQAMAMMDFMADNPAHTLELQPTLAASDQALDRYIASNSRSHDANDVLYAFESSKDYDPWPRLEKITAPLLAINSADDLINPPDIQVLQRGIEKVKNGKAVVLPETPATRGHGTHTMAWMWKGYLEQLLKESEK